MARNTNERITVTRGNLGQIASFIGATSLLISFLGLVWQGGLTPYLIALLVTGAVGIVAWAALVPQEFINFVTGRQARQGTVAVFSTLLVIGIMVLFYIFVERAVITLDMTNAQDFSLSVETRDLLDELNREVRITGFYSPELLPSRELDDQVYRQYSAESDGLVTRNYIDPVREPDITQQFNAVDGDVFLSYINDDGTVDFSSLIRLPREGKQERLMSQALARLLAVGNFVVYFEVGHGTLNPADSSNTGISSANALLVNGGYITQPIDLAQLAADGETVPEDATAIVIPRPQEQFSQSVIGVLDEYLNQGGAVFITTDANFGPSPFLSESSMFNNYLWENWGLRMLDAVVVDDAVSDPTPLDVISFAISDLPMTANIDPGADPTTATIFREARVVQVDPEPPVNNGSVIQTSDFSYGETNLTALASSNRYELTPEEDILGPVTTVGYAIDVDTDGKVMLVGDSDFLTNGQITSTSFIGNALLFNDSIGWMTGFSDQISIAPQPVGAGLPFIGVSAAMLDRIAFVTLFLIPGLTLAMGAGVWYVRNRR